MKSDKPEILLYVGPMYAGKTSALMAMIKYCEKNHLKVGVFDHTMNNRNSERDLANLYPNTMPFDKTLALTMPWDVVIVDECHFFSVAKDESNLMELICASKAKLIVLAGLQYDYFQKNVPFPIWTEIFRYATLHGIGLEVRQMETCQSCFDCGQWREVRFSAKIGNSKERVGNHYVNCCHACSNKRYEQMIALDT